MRACVCVCVCVSVLSMKHRKTGGGDGRNRSTEDRQINGRMEGIVEKDARRKESEENKRLKTRREGL